MCLCYPTISPSVAVLFYNLLTGRVVLCGLSIREGLFEHLKYFSIAFVWGTDLVLEEVVSLVQRCPHFIVSLQVYVITSPPLPHPHTHTPNRPHHRQLSKPRRTGCRPPQSHQTPPIVEPSHTPTSHPQPPRPSAPVKSSSPSGVLVLYDLVDISVPAVKRPPFAKKHPSSNITLADFKEKIFSRKGDYRCV